MGEASRQTLGIFGTGLIGKEVAKKAKAFDMHVMGFNTSGQTVQYFDEIYTQEQKNIMIPKCDFVVLLLPLTEETQHFFNKEEFDLMKQNGYFINVGRGPLIKEEALVHALNNKKIKGAALDVFYKKPLSSNSPLWEADNLIITPHLSGKTKYFFERCVDIFIKNHQLFKAIKR